MRVVKKGEGQPEYTVLGSIHGDEPAGKKAIEKFLSEKRNFRKPVQFIIGNEEALEEDERYLEADLNRSFPGDKDSELHEERLASEILEKVEGTRLLDIHTTRSYPVPFATCSTLEEEKVLDLVRSTGVKEAAYFSEEQGNITEHVDGVVVETGYQKTEQAAENALGVIKNFLICQGVIEGEGRRSNPEFFEVTDRVDGDWNFKAENFKKVEEGQIYAEKEGAELEATEEFYPVLMSTNGYNGTLGYRARKKEI